MSRPDKTVTDKTNAIRRKAGNPLDMCPTCARSVALPYYRKDAHGYVAEGCVDASHVNSTLRVPGYREWFFRPAAMAIRAATLATLVR